MFSVELIICAKVCNHLDLINETLASHVAQGFKQLPAGINDSTCPIITKNHGKFNVLFLVLSQWHNKHKALIFCQQTNAEHY